MKNSAPTDASSEHQSHSGDSRPRTRFWWLLLALMMICFGGCYVLVATEAGSRVLFQQVLHRFESIQGLYLQAEDVSGTFATSLKVSSLQGGLSSARLRWKMRDVSLRLHFRSLLQRKIRMEHFRCRDCRVEGPHAPDSLPVLPSLPMAACLAAPDYRFSIDSVNIDSLLWEPWATSSLCLEVKGLRLQSGLASQPDLLASLVGKFQDRPFVRATYTADVATHGRQIEGNLEAAFLGGGCSMSLAGRWNRKNWLLSGHLKNSSVSLASVSHWLQNQWQDSFPIGFEGLLNVEGPWMFGPEVGWCCNLVGRLQAGKVVALGFMYALLQLDTEMSLFNDVFQLLKPEALFLGFPAHIRGEIAQVFSQTRRWDIHSQVPELRIDHLMANLPWSMRYLMTFHPLAGLASLTVQIQGRAPSIRSKLVSHFDVLEPGIAPASFSSELEFRREVPQIGEWTGWFRWSSAYLPPSLKVAGLGTQTMETFLGHPVELQLQAHGPTTADLRFQGGITGPSGRFALTAQQMEGAWVQWSLRPEPSLGYPFSLTEIPSLGQLLLLQP